MKIISLNTAGGALGKTPPKPYLDFIKKYANKVDIFFLEEMFSSTRAAVTAHPDHPKVNTNVHELTKEYLLDYTSYFSPIQDLLDEDTSGMHIEFTYGNSLFIRKGIEHEYHESFIYKEQNGQGKPGGNMPRTLQGVSIPMLDGETYFFGHMHGVWLRNQGKVDTPERIAQSEKVLKVLDKYDHTVLMGDFNLRPDTKSLAMLEKNMVNLIKTYNVQTTRTKLYDKKNEEPFADYALISPRVDVEHFEVLGDLVSDHCPLYLNVDVPLPQ